MIKKTVGSTTTLLMYDESGHLLGEYSSTGALVQETVWMGDIPVATLRPNGSSISIYYVHTDQLGTPRKVTRPSDNKLAWRWDADPFGTVAPNQNPQSLGTFVYNLRFPGQYYESETALSYNYFRDYDPKVGRYIESDPIGLRGGVNAYAYVRGNPLTYRDPSGEFGVFGFGFGVAAGAAAGYVAGGWQGAVAGAAVGGLVGIVAPWASAEAAAVAGEGIAGMFAATGATVAIGGLSGAAATVAGNAIAGKCDKTEGIVFGTALGALAPLMSGEAFIIGAGADAAVGTGAADFFSVLTGLFGTIGAAADPNAQHGFR